MSSSHGSGAMRASGPDLVRRLGPVDGASIIVSNVIGSGIFLVPALVAVWIPDVWLMLAAWFVGGVLAFTGAMAYAELATLHPRAGGEYVYLREAFGPTVGFLSGWTSFVAGFSGAIAAGAVGFASFLGRLVPFAGDTEHLFRVPLWVLTLVVTPQTLVALTVIATLTIVHVVGVGPGRIVQNVLAAAKVLVLVILVVLGFSVGDGAIDHLWLPSLPVAPTMWLLALIPIMFSFSGWNAATYVAEEIRNPARNVPLAMVLGTAAVVVLYILLNLLYVYAIPLVEIGQLQTRVVDEAAGRIRVRGAQLRLTNRQGPLTQRQRCVGIKPLFLIVRFSCYPYM